MKPKQAQFSVDGELHKVVKNAKGDIVVEHPDGGKTYDLTKLSGADTIAEGVSSVKDWHRKNG